MKKNYLKCGVALLAIASTFSAFAEDKTLEFNFAMTDGAGGVEDLAYPANGNPYMIVNKTLKTFTYTRNGQPYLFHYYGNHDPQIGQYQDCIQFGVSQSGGGNTKLGYIEFVLGNKITGMKRVEVVAKCNENAGLIMLSTVNGVNSSSSLLNAHRNMHINLLADEHGQNETAGSPDGAGQHNLTNAYRTYIWNGTSEVTGTPMVRFLSNAIYFVRIKSIKITYTGEIETTASPLVFSASTKPDAETQVTYYATFSNADRDVVIPSTAGVVVNRVNVENNILTMSPLSTANYAIKMPNKSDNTVDGYLVPAGTGVLVSMPYAGSNVLNTTAAYAYNGTADELTEGNQLKPTTQGTIDALTNHYIYRLAYDNKENETGLGFYWGNAYGTQILNATPGKAYLEVPITHGAPAIRGFSFDGNHLTAVEDIKVNDEAINANEPIYDLSGRRVENPTKGFYIQGNKKFVIR